MKYSPKNLVIKGINKYFFNYKNPKYHRFLYDLSRRYVDFFRGEHNSDMSTNGEEKLMKLLVSHYAPRILVDVGANEGEYSQFMLSLNPQLVIHAFEPDPVVSTPFKKGNAAKKNIHVNNIALDATVGKKDFFVYRDASELNSFHEMDYHRSDVQKLEVETDTLENYCKKRNVSHIDILKVDVEGHELPVFKGAKSLLEKKQVDLVQFEFGNAAIYSRTFFRDLYDFFVSMGYNLYKIKPQELEKVTYIPEYEKIMYANFLAVAPKEKFDSLEELYKKAK